MPVANESHIYIDTNRVISAISPLLFSGFAEHMGRCVYEGIYDPASPHAESDFFYQGFWFAHYFFTYIHHFLVVNRMFQ